jgi:hypothetical protein
VGRSVVVLARLFLILLLLALLALGFLRLELLFPQLVRGVLVELGEDDLEYFVVPLYGPAVDAFFDILVKC